VRVLVLISQTCGHVRRSGCADAGVYACLSIRWRALLPLEHIQRAGVTLTMWPALRVYAVYPRRLFTGPSWTMLHFKTPWLSWAFPSCGSSACSCCMQDSTTLPFLAAFAAVLALTEALCFSILPSTP